MSKFDEDYDFYEENFDKGVEASAGKAAKTEIVKFPTAYAYEGGTYKFRVYPENYNGIPRWIRYMDFHQLHNYRKVITKEFGGEPAVNKIIERAENAGLKSRKNGAWRHKKSNEAVMLVYLIQAPEKYKDLEGKAVALVLNWQHIKSWKLFTAQLEEDPEDFGYTYKQFLDPRAETPAIKMVVHKEQKGASKQTSVNISATGNTFELPKLSEALPDGIEFTGLDDLYVKESSTLNDKLLEEFEKYIDGQIAELEKHRSENQYNPESPESGGGYSPKSKAPKVEALDDDDEEDALPWETSAVKNA